MLRSLAILLLLTPSASLARASVTGDGKADFDAALVQVGRMMDARLWEKARGFLQGKLAEHVDQEYVRERLPEIQERLKRCSFEIACPPKEVADLFCGALVSYDAATGQIELRYKRLEAAKGGDESPLDELKLPAPFPCDDFTQTGEERVLMLPFEGPYSVELSGKAMDQILPTVRVGIGQAATYTITYDFGSLSTIALGDVTVASSSTFNNVSRPYTIKISVRDTKIEAAHNNKRIVSAEKAKGMFGQFGFAQFANLEQIHVLGKADRAWIEGHLDSLAKAERAEFEETYDPDKLLPQWLRAK
jgi:hypothetical protein